MIHVTKDDIVQSTNEAIIIPIQLHDMANNGCELSLRQKHVWLNDIMSSLFRLSVMRMGESVVYENPTPEPNGPRYVIGIPLKRNVWDHYHPGQVRNGLISMFDHLRTLNVNRASILSLGFDTEYYTHSVFMDTLTNAWESSHSQCDITVHIPTVTHNLFDF